MNGHAKQWMNTDTVAFKNRTESKISKYQRACCFEQWISTQTRESIVYCQRDYLEPRTWNHKYSLNLIQHPYHGCIYLRILNGKLDLSKPITVLKRQFGLFHSNSGVSHVSTIARNNIIYIFSRGNGVLGRSVHYPWPHRRIFLIAF